MSKTLELVPAQKWIEDSGAYSHCRWRLLAEGDSWFSIGAFNPFKNANLLQNMAFSSFAVAAHCSYPGDTLRHIADFRNDPHFVQLLTGPVSWRWDAILLSAGGNDLIDAAQSKPEAPVHLRLLRKPSEWGPVSEGVGRYVSDDGWSTFEAYFRANLDLLIALRDSKHGPNGSAGRPLCMHTYAYLTPRPAGAGAGYGPWLLPALVSYGVPEPDWPQLARHMVDRMADLLLACAADQVRFPALHVFDTRPIPINPASPGATGVSGDWSNEIHLTRAGCRKLALPWCTALEAVMLAAGP
jgi:hypothetical protein